MSRDDLVLESEGKLAGALIINPGLIETLSPLPTLEDFQTPMTRAVVAAVLAVHGRHPARVYTWEEGLAAVEEQLSLSEENHAALREHARSLSEQHCTEVGSPAHARILREARNLRTMGGLLASLHAQTRNGIEDVPGWLSSSAEAVAALVDGTVVAGSDPGQDLRDAVSDRITPLEDMINGTAPKEFGLLTGLGPVDAKLVGFKPGELVVVAARPGMGKTAFLLNMVTHIITGALPTRAAFLTMEQSKRSVVDRLIAQVCLIPLAAVLGRAPWPDSYMGRFVHGIERLKANRAHVYDVPGITPSGINGLLRRHKRRHGLDIAFVDHLLEVQPDYRDPSRPRELGEILSAVRRMAKALEVPVVLATQIGREATKRSDRRPQLSDLKESGSIEEKADHVLFLHRPAYYDDQAPKAAASVGIAKQRDGETGWTDVAWDASTLRFVPAETRY